MKSRGTRDLAGWIGSVLLRLIILSTILFLFVFLVMIFIKGGKVLSWSFLTEFPRRGMTAGGILPAIVGTFELTMLSVLIAFPIGILTAIFLNEYGRPRWLVSIINTAINTLAGVPSIVFGLFGLALFVNALGFGVSLLSGSLTLAIVILPIIINATVEALRSVPREFREASLALGATRRQTILRVVLPAALPSILTGVIISVGRAAGETAPILFTAAAFFNRELATSVLDEVMALPYQIYALMTEGTKPEFQVPIAYGSAIVLLFLVMGINIIAIIVRYNIRRKRRW
jgi:phosphate transport system permease protein